MDRYGRWTVESTFVDNYRTKASVVCDCGEKTIVPLSNLKSGRSKMCRRCSYDNRGPTFAARKTGSWLAERDKYKEYRRRSLKKKQEFSLTLEEFLDITRLNCFFCHRPPSNVHRVYGKDWAEPFIYTGIDRLNNKIGYTMDNVIPCCKICNYGKRDLTVEEFIQNCRRVVEVWELTR